MYDEVIVVFDTYKGNSLKNATREKRRHGKGPIKYQIRDDTKINHVTMSHLLSHHQTKADLTDYLAVKTLDYSKESSKLVIISASGHTKSNSKLVFEDNNHEEADTLMIFQAVCATVRNRSNVQLTIFSPDTCSSTGYCKLSSSAQQHINVNGIRSSTSSTHWDCLRSQQSEGIT